MIVNKNKGVDFEAWRDRILHGQIDFQRVFVARFYKEL